MIPTFWQSLSKLGAIAHAGRWPSIDPERTGSWRRRRRGLAADSASSACTTRGAWERVFLARDGEVNREVALKQMKEEIAADPQLRARFVFEAEITGNLEHPGIVPVYGKGEYSDGRPYYAMRFIRGDNLKVAVDRFHKDPDLKSDAGARQREFQKLLRRFLVVCETMSYAHSRGHYSSRSEAEEYLARARMARPWWWIGGWPRWSGTARRPTPSDATLRPPSGSDIQPTDGWIASGHARLT